MLGLCGGPWRWAPRSPASRGPDARGGPSSRWRQASASQCLRDPRLRGSTLESLDERGVPDPVLGVQELGRGSFLSLRSFWMRAHGSVWWSMGCGGRGGGELGPDLWEHEVRRLCPGAPWRAQGEEHSALCLGSLG